VHSGVSKWISVVEHGSALLVEAIPATEPGLTLHRVARFFLTLGRSEMGPDHYPSVVVINQVGQQFHLFGASNWEEAIAKRDRLRAELADMDEEIWCDRYVVRT
jgi:hypothetical protein